MKDPGGFPEKHDEGFSLTEMMVALLIAMIVMAAVFALLQKGQGSFRREPEVADVNQSARVGLDMITRDLMLAGYKVPPAMAVLWDDGGGINPDEVTIVYCDENVPTSEPIKCGGAGGGGGGGPCNTIGQSATLNIDPATFDPSVYDTSQSFDADAEARAEAAYADGMILHAIETSDCNGDGQIGIIPFEVTQPPQVTSAGGEPTLQINHNPGQGQADVNMPGGFNREVHPDCAIIGLFRVVQYRVNPPPPTPNPVLERRDLSSAEPWIPVSNNIENLQVQYALGDLGNFVDAPPSPNGEDPTTWITRVRVTVAGRSESINLEGSSPGVFAAQDTHLRKTFSTVVSLRNQVYSAAQKSNQTKYN